MLKEALLEEYGGFADKRIKHIDKGTFFNVDDRSLGDFGADKELLSPVCAISVDVKSEEQIQLVLSRNVPMSGMVEEWIAESGAAYNGSPWPRRRLVIMVSRGEQSKLAGLASAIRSIVAPGAPHYQTRNYKYCCPRTAVSLERLKGALDKVWG